MATATIVYSLIAKDGASSKFDKAGKSANGLGKVMGGLAKTAKLAGEGILAVGAAVAVSAKKAAEFQTTMTRIGTQAGGSAADVTKLSKAVLQLAPSTQQGPQQLAESLYHLKSVGMDNASAMKALKESSDLAAVGGANLEETTNALAGAWRTGIKGATDFHGAVSTVNAIIGAGNMSMEQFNAAIGTGILPSAKTFGLSMKQVGAALALMTDEGIDSASAATRLRMSFSLLGAPSKAAEKQLGKIGLTGLQLADAMRGKDGLIGAIQLLKDHLDASGMSASEQSQVLSRAFGGGKSSSGILLMINNLDVLKKKQDQVNRSTGKFADAVKTQRKTAEAQLKILESNFQTFAIKIGTKALPPITSLMSYINKTALPTLGKFAGALVSMLPIDTIKARFEQAKGYVKDFTDLIGLTQPKTVPSPLAGAPHLGSGQVGSKPYVKPGPLVGAPHLGSAQVAPPKAASQMQSGITKAFDAIDWSAIGKHVSDAMAAIDWKAVGRRAGAGLGTAFGVVVSELDKIIGKTDFVGIGKTLGKVALPTAIGFVNTLFDPLFTADFWKKHWLDFILAAISIVPVGKVGGAGAKLLGKVPWGKLGEVVSKALGKIPWGKIFSIGDRINWGKVFTLGDAGPAAARWVTSLVDRIGRSISRQFPRLSRWVGKELELLPTRLGTYAIDFGRWASKTMRGLGKSLMDLIPGTGNKWFRAVVKFFARFSLYQVGINLGKSLLSGIDAGLTKVGDWLKAHVVDPVVNWTKAHFGIHSPSTVFISIGRQLISGLKAGIVAGAVKIGGWIHSHVISPVTGAFSGAGSWLYGKGRSTVSGLKNGIVSGASKIGGWVHSHLISPVTGAFSGAGTWLHGKGGSLVSGLKNGIVDGASKIGTWIKSNLVDPIVGSVKKYFGIKSPSTVMAGLGGHLVAGLMKGLATHDGASIARKIFGSLPNALGAIVGKGLVHISSLPGKALSALGNLGGKFGSLLGGLFGGGGGGKGVGQWSGTVKTVLAMLGAPSSALNAVLTRIGIESGGNPKAINLTDSNAKAGHPSQGLMQTIPSTFNAYAGPFRGRGITDPLASVYAGVNYAMHRYGKNWVSVMTRPGGYDSGGLARGVGYLPKYTVRPERVLSPRQTAAFERLVDNIDSGGSGGAKGGDTHNTYNYHLTQKDMTVRDLELLQRRQETRARVGRAR